MSLRERLYLRWSNLVFGVRAERLTPKIMSLRVLEESVELVQAWGVSRENVLKIVDQVFAKHPGEPAQEFGGVMVTAVGYAAVSSMDSDKAFWTEFERIMDPEVMDRVRYRNLHRDKIGLKEIGS